jgi:hypothetical protein
MIRESQYYMGRDKTYAEELTGEIEANAAELLAKVNNLLAALGFPDPEIRSGWRPPQINDSTSNAAAHSKHLTGQAVDLADDNRELATAIMRETNVLTQFGLYMEDCRWTPTWVHLQGVPPGSGKHIFIPSSAPPIAPPVLA